MNLIFERPALTINGTNFMIDNEYKVVENREDEYKNLCNYNQ